MKLVSLDKRQTIVPEQTNASELFGAGVPKRIIKERTGHQSLDALHVYEHTTST